MRGLYSTFIAILLAVNSAFAQSAAADLAAKPENERWGWFQPEQWASNLMLQQPGWKIKDRGKKPDGWDYVLYMANDGSRAVSFQMQGGSIGTVSFMFSGSSPSAKEWLTTQFEKVDENEWLDRPNNARVKRRYNGSIVVYTVAYEPFVKD